MDNFNAWERVCYRRTGDPNAREGFGKILEIDGIWAQLLWEDDQKEGRAETRYLISEKDAQNEDLV